MKDVMAGVRGNNEGELEDRSLMPDYLCTEVLFSTTFPFFLNATITQ